MIRGAIDPLIHRVARIHRAKWGEAPVGLPLVRTVRLERGDELANRLFVRGDGKIDQVRGHGAIVAYPRWSSAQLHGSLVSIPS